jgi:hypothetical protein
MNQDITNYEQDSKVTPYHIKSADRTHDQRRLRNLCQSQRAAIQAGVDIKAATKDYEAVCQTKSKPLADRSHAVLPSDSSPSFPGS